MGKALLNSSAPGAVRGSERVEARYARDPEIRSGLAPGRDPARLSARAAEAPVRDWGPADRRISEGGSRISATGHAWRNGVSSARRSGSTCRGNRTLPSIDGQARDLDVDHGPARRRRWDAGAPLPGGAYFSDVTIGPLAYGADLTESRNRSDPIAAHDPQRDFGVGDESDGRKAARSLVGEVASPRKSGRAYTGGGLCRARTVRSFRN